MKDLKEFLKDTMVENNIEYFFNESLYKSMEESQKEFPLEFPEKYLIEYQEDFLKKPSEEFLDYVKYLRTNFLDKFLNTYLLISKKKR